MSSTEETVVEAPVDSTGRCDFLTFQLNGEKYGVAMDRIEEIIGVTAITPVPRAQPNISGVINLRGKIIPIVDLRLTFAFPPAELDEQSCFIVVRGTIDGESILAGLIVDRVHEVMSFSRDQLRTVNSSANDTGNTRYLSRMACFEEQVIFFVNIDEVFSTIHQNRRVGIKSTATEKLEAH